MALANPDDPYVDDKGAVVVQKGNGIDKSAPEIVRVPNIMAHEPSRARSAKDLPATIGTQQQAIFVVLGYHLAGLTSVEIAHEIGVDLVDVKNLMADESFQQSFSLLFNEIINLNSKSLVAKMHHYSHNAFQRIVNLSNKADKDMVSLKASQDILDRGGITPKNLGFGEEENDADGLRIVINDNSSANININVGKKK